MYSIDRRRKKGAGSYFPPEDLVRLLVIKQKLLKVTHPYITELVETHPVYTELYGLENKYIGHFHPLTFLIQRPHSA